MWSEGSLKVRNGIFHYWVKHYDKPSKYGINKGQVSKLTLKRNGEIVYNFDRGLGVEAADEDTELALAILLKEYN